MNILKNFITLLVVMCCTSYCIAQNSITIVDFLKGAKQNQSVDFQNQKFYFLATNSRDLPIVEKLEFRTETTEFDPSRQEYLMRISPNSLKRIKTQRQYQQTIRNMSKMELAESLGEAIRLRYDLLVNYICLKKILAAKNNHNILFRDKVTLLKRSITLPNFDVLELIDAEDKAQNNLHDILDLETSILTILNTIQRVHHSDDTIQIDSERLVNINDVRLILNEMVPSEVVTHPGLEVLSAKLYSNVLAYDWENAKTKFSLGYVQAKYGYEPGDNFKKNFSVGIGFEIPISSSSQLDMNELQIKIYESELQYTDAKNKLIEQRYALYQQLNNSINKHEVVSSNLNESQAEFALKEYSKIAEASPKALLKLRENTLEKELLLRQLEFKIMQQFIEYLDLQGAFTQEPLRNYLSKTLEYF